MLHEIEEDGVEGILSLYDTPFGLSTYLAVDAASYDIRLRSTEIKMFSDNVCRLQLFRCCLVVTVPIHVCRRRVVTLLQYQFITEIKMFSDNVTVPIVTVYNVCFYILIQYQFTCLSLLQYGHVGQMPPMISHATRNTGVIRCVSRSGTREKQGSSG